jgi:hypothetical protein
MQRATCHIIIGASRIACALMLALCTVDTVRAQHASDDPVAAANDGFGLTLGLESIGLYGPGFVRGFSPQVAGNVLSRGRDTVALFAGPDVVDLRRANSRPHGALERRIRLSGAMARTRRLRIGHAAGELHERRGLTDSIRGTLQGSAGAHLRNGRLELAERVTAYAGYTQGLEDSGVAASSAGNRGAIMPDARTWQSDTGIRYLPNP